MKPSKASAVPIAGLAHIGVRVHDLERSVRFHARAIFVRDPDRNVIELYQRLAR